MTNLWILTGFATFMTVCVVIVGAVALAASLLATRRTANREAFSNTRGLPPVPENQPERVRPVRRGDIDLEQLRTIVLEGPGR